VEICTFDRKNIHLEKGTVVDGNDDQNNKYNSLIGIRSVLEDGNGGGLIGIRSLYPMCSMMSPIAVDCRGLRLKLLKSPNGRSKEIKFKTRNTYDTMDDMAFTTPLRTLDEPGEVSVWWNVDFDRQKCQLNILEIQMGEKFNRFMLTGFKFVYSKFALYYWGRDDGHI
jgi:hypothetical protein